MESGEMSYKKTSVAEDIWKQTTQKSMTCPQCKGFLTVVQVEPIYDTDNAYTPLTGPLLNAPPALFAW
jgi:hypothetical protein